MISRTPVSGCGSDLQIAIRRLETAPTICSIALLVVLATTCGVARADRTLTVHELLVDPARSEGQIVAVEGYLRPHVLYLFPSRELADAQDWQAALIVGDEPSGSIRDSACPDRIVEMTGTFRQLDPGIYGLTDISLVRLAGGGDVCWSRDAQAAPDSPRRSRPD